MTVLLILIQFTAGELGLIHNGLEIINLSEHDLSYGKNWPREDSFRLKVINRLMNRPLTIPSYVNKLVGSLGDEKKTIVNLAQQLDYHIKKPGNSEFDNWKQGLEELKKNLNRGDSLILESLKELTESELDSLLVQLPIIWADKDDTLSDTLKITLIEDQLIDTSFEWGAEDILRIAKKIHCEDIIESGARVFDIVINFIPHIKHIPVESLPMEMDYRYGKIIIGSYGHDVYRDGDVIIDPAGDDLYLGQVAGGIKEIGIVVDLAGNDTYLSNHIAAQGSGILGVGVLYDLEGNDRYNASHYSQGSGLFGVGILIDKMGKDNFEAGFFAQGAGNFGIGLLINGRGNDLYRTSCYSQGFASVKGIGVIIDSTGNDTYYAGGKYPHHPLLPDNYRSLSQGFALGWRPIASGGIGLLYDGMGNDSYVAEVYGQGTSYWFSIGALIDNNGNDRYLATEYAQGSGVHYAIGLLQDQNGSDLYYSTHGPAQGEGHDLSVGILIDRNGSDNYITSGGQGIGLNNSIGILIDGDGDDHYSTYEPETGQGGANWRGGFGGVGLFIDQAGIDHYPKGNAANDKVWLQGSYGVGIDISSSATFECYPILPDDTLGLDTLNQDSLIVALFDRASLWRVRENIEIVDWAREKLYEIGKPSIDYAFVEKINTDATLELRAMKWLGKKMKTEARPYLIQALESEIDTVVKNALWLIGEIADSVIAYRVENSTEHEDFRIRCQAISTLGKIGDSTVTKAILRHVDDDRELVRIKVCEALGKIRDKESIEDLIYLLVDEFFTVRYSAARALIAIGKAAVNPVIKRIKWNPYLTITVLSKIGKDLSDKDKRKVADAISPYVSNRNPIIAQKAKQAIKNLEFRSFLSPHQLLKYQD